MTPSALALRRIREAAVTTRWSESEWPGAPSDAAADRSGLGRWVAVH